jgi:hypothetical protein
VEENPDDPPVIPDIPVLDREKLALWLELVRQHVPKTESIPLNAQPTGESPSPSTVNEAADQELDLKPPKDFEPIYARASLMGRDADFSWFRFVIPSKMIFRDDLRMGTHDFVPLDPGDTFLLTQPELYLVFALATPSYDEVMLTAQCFVETSKISGHQQALAQDQVVMSMNEQSGYFRLQAPSGGWQPGLYRCGLFVGEELSAYNHADEVRFRILPSEVTPTVVP